MDSARSQIGSRFVLHRIVQVACSIAISVLVGPAWFGGAAYAQTTNLLTTLFPYNGNTLPIDYTKAIYGKTIAELCAQRTDAEIMAAYGPPVGEPLLYVGLLPDGTHCGYQWLNTTPNPPVVISEPVFGGDQFYCSNVPSLLGVYPNAAVPQSCVMNCTADQADSNGCRSTSPKGAGAPPPHSCCGNPVNAGTGNKFQVETDLPPAQQGDLAFTRYYNTGLSAPRTKVFGGFWQHNYNRKIVVNDSTGTATYYVPDGKVLTFHLVSGVWTSDADIKDVLLELKNSNGTRTGWQYTLASNDDVETYDVSGNPLAIQNRAGLTTHFVYSDGTNGATSGNGGYFLDALGNPTTTVLAKGLLLRVADPFGRTLTFGYDASYRIVKITDPAGDAMLYSYDVRSNLTSVSYPDGHQRTYLYNETAQTGGALLPYNLTGIIDENGARFATFAYDSSGRATKTTHNVGATEVDRYTLSYDVSGVQTTIVDPLGTSRANGLQTVVGVVKQNAETQPAASGTVSTAITYDANGNVASRTDWNGNRTNYSYDLARNLETQRVEGLTTSGATTPQTRTISTEWDANFRLPTRVAEPLRITTNVYDADGTTCGARGALCSKTIQATTDANGGQGFSATASGTPRTWTYTYNANGLVLTANGPRTDVADTTTYTYYANNDADLGKRGNVATITNALGQVTQITAYNANGQPLTIVDSNGLTTTLAYDARMRLTSRNVGGETTGYTYDGVGQLTKVTLPDGSYLTYTYDAAHRLTGMQDNLGNKIAYTLDAMGNRTQEQVLDPANALAQTRSRVYSNLNRLFQEIGAAGQTTQYSYDNQGNVTGVTDPLNHTTANAYDALNRLKQVTDPNSGVTQYAYNGLDALTSVTDPRSLASGYTVDGLGNLTQQVSPDTGTTTNTYDAAGNLLTQTDAKNQTTTYFYDALNRVTSITFQDGSKQTYTYDQGTNGLGRLTGITETDAANQVTDHIAYAYDQHGRVTSESRTINAVPYVTAYSYDSAGRMNGMTYPSGRTVAYAFDALGRVSEIDTTKDTQTQVVVQNVAYQPFGGVKSYTLGNGQVYSRTIDQDGRIASYTLGNSTYGISFDAASRITGIAETGNPANANTYGYDPLDRLTSAVLPSSSFGYGYDAVGNRLTKTVGANSDSYTYSPTSNQIASITPATGPVRIFAFDANGSTTNDGTNQYAYDARGRLVQATTAQGTTTYQINALGQRFRKTNSSDDRVFLYDARGHLIAETDPGGGLKREILYLGDIPVGVVQ